MGEGIGEGIGEGDDSPLSWRLASEFVRCGSADGERVLLCGLAALASGSDSLSESSTSLYISKAIHSGSRPGGSDQGSLPVVLCKPAGPFRNPA
jgi:hypothetical protein